MMLARFLPATLLALVASHAAALEISLSYLSVPATFSYVQYDKASGDREQKSRDISFGTAGLMVHQVLPPLLEDWPVRFGLECGFGLPTGSQSFDQSERYLNASGVTKTERREGDSIEWSAFVVPLMLTAGYLPPPGAVSLWARAGLGVVLTQVREVETDQVYTGPLEDPDYFTVSYTHQGAALFALELTGGALMPLTEAVSFGLSGGAVWMAAEDFGAKTVDSSGDWVEALKVGGIGLAVRAGLASTL